MIELSQHMDPIKILIVDDQPIIRRGIALLLGMEEGIEIIGQAQDGEEAITLTSQLKPHIVLMDLQMPRLSGIAATRRIIADSPDTRVVILTTFDTDDLVFEAIRAGAHAYLLKDATEAEILDTIHAVQRGEFRLTASIARKAMEFFQHIPLREANEDEPNMRDVSSDRAEATTTAFPLTPREQKILELIAQGYSNKRIANAVFLAEGTVKNYVSRIMEKLHAKTRTELAVMALQSKDG
jgi:DNA-binding NarL/FixJ family response regulator